MEVELNEAEQRLARWLARERHRRNRTSGVENMKVSDIPDDVVDLDGMGGELAFAKLFNCFPDTGLDAKPDADVVLPDGRSVDVKTTRYQTGRLLAVRWKTRNVDLYALMVGVFPRYRFAGMLPAEKLIHDDKLIDLGHGETFGASQDELEDLIPW